MVARTLFVICLAGVLFLTCSVLADSASEDLQNLLDEAWEFRLREDPLFATECGDHRYNGRLQSVSLDDVQRRQEVEQGFLDRVEEIDADQLTAGEQTNLAIFKRELQNRLDEYRFGNHLLPISGRSGFHITFPELSKRIPLNSTEDYENYIARLREFLPYVQGHVELMREGARLGVTQPGVILERYREPIDPQIVEDPKQSLLYEPFMEFPDGVPSSEHERLQGDAVEAIATSVVPGYQEFLKFMTDEYVPNCRGSIGASGLPEGRDYYRFRTQKYTTLPITPEEVHALGLREVERIRGEMEAIIEQVGFEGDFAEFTEFLRNDPRFYAKTEEDYLRRVAWILKQMDGRLPALFGRLPRTPYGLKPIPAFIAPQTTSAYYQPPMGDGSKAGFYYINTYDLASRPLYTSEALALHEAVPGHHLQIALQQELDLPDFRKFGGFTAFIEGWALYAERLGLEAGFYEDPYSDFGRLTMEIWRASRLVVDSGIHYFGWTREEAIEFLTANSAMSKLNIRAEVDRYIGWPGQALAYKMGELKIRELRQKAEDQLGDQFDIREFHDVVLGSGAVPLDLLEANVNEWLAGQ